MRFSRAAWPVFAAAGLLLGVASACGSSSSSNVNGGDGTAANGTGANGTGVAGKTGTGPVLGGLAGESATNGGSSSAVGEECAGNLIEAERIPLDMYVMLDVSGSMLEPTADATVTKWDAVSSALTDFVGDPASAGIGMGLQVFPIQHPDAPGACKSDNECGQFGPCFLKTCWSDPAGALCNSALDCPGTGPCTAFAFCSNSDRYICD